MTPLPQASLSMSWKTRGGGGERNGERCGRRERRSVSVMVKENGIENEGCKRREERVGEDIGRRGYEKRGEGRRREERVGGA